MHELFTQVIAEKDLSKAGDLFSLDDKDIEGDLSEVLNKIHEIAQSADYAVNDNNQSVVEICITRVTTAIRETQSVEKHTSALVRLLQGCLEHNLQPSTKDEDTPHTKIASDIMSCVFLHYSKRAVMERTLPTVVRFLACENKELSRNVSSYLSLAAIDNADLLAKHIDLILSSILSGNPSLTRVLPQMYVQNKEPILKCTPELMDLLTGCELTERLSLFELFSLIAKYKPKLLEPYVDKMCEYLSHTLLIPLVLGVLVDIAVANPTAVESQIPLLKQTVQQQQSTTLPQVAQIVGALGNISETHARESMDYLVGQLSSTEHAIQPIVLQEIRAICLTNHSLLGEHIQEINKLSQTCASSVRILIEQLKEDQTKYSGEKEMRSVSSQTDGNVTIITVGSPPTSSYSSGTGTKSSTLTNGSLRSSEQSLSKSSKTVHSSRASGASTPNFRSQAERSNSPTSEKGSVTGSVNNNNNTTTGMTTLPLIEPVNHRDTIQHFCEKHLTKIKNYINTVSARIPLPAKCCVVNGRHKRYVKLNFLCVKQGDQCLYSQIYFSMDTKTPKTWIHLMFLAIQSRASTALSTQDPAVSSLRACWDALKMERTASNFLTLVTSSFPSQKDQDSLIQELHSVRYFDVFEFNAPEKVWACFMCNHPDTVSNLLQDGLPVIAGQLKEKKGRWKFLKRWKTRYFTLSGAHITYSKSDSPFSTFQRKESLPVAKIQSVKAVRKGIRDIPRAFEIFTADQTYIFKAKDRKNAEQWVQCLHIAVARTQKQEKQGTQSVKVGRPRVGISDTKL